MNTTSVMTIILTGGITLLFHSGQECCPPDVSILTNLQVEFFPVFFTPSKIKRNNKEIWKLRNQVLSQLTRKSRQRRCGSL